MTDVIDWILQKRSFLKINNLPLLVENFVATRRRDKSLIRQSQNVKMTESLQSDFRKSAETILLAKSPPSVTVNDQVDIVHGSHCHCYSGAFSSTG